MEIGDLKYPYYIGPFIEEYRKLDPESPAAKQLRNLISVNVSDSTTLCLLLGVESTRLDSLYPGMGKSGYSTMETIDSFLAKYGGNNGSIPGAYMPEIPVEDHSQPVEPPKEKHAKKQQQTTEISDSQLKTKLTELIKEKRFEAALQIIEQQNLINPKKNIYFADQIRFLKKLIKIKNSQNNNQG